eukprot:EG_transcript_17508
MSDDEDGPYGDDFEGTAATKLSRAPSGSSRSRSPRSRSRSRSRSGSRGRSRSRSRSLSLSQSSRSGTSATSSPKAKEVKSPKSPISPSPAFAAGNGERREEEEKDVTVRADPKAAKAAARAPADVRRESVASSRPSSSRSNTGADRRSAAKAAPPRLSRNQLHPHDRAERGRSPRDPRLRPQVDGRGRGGTPTSGLSPLSARSRASNASGPGRSPRSAHRDPTRLGADRRRSSASRSPQARRRSTEGFGKPGGDRRGKADLLPSSDLLNQLRKTNAALNKQLAQAEAQWRELQRQNREAGVAEPEGRGNVVVKLPPGLANEYEKLKSEYTAQKKTNE